MSPGPIPGFYYDGIKKKYFKILSNHVAPTGSKYSEQYVKREAVDNVVRKRHKTYDQRRLQTRIDRPRLRDHLLGGAAGLGRELDGCSDRRCPVIEAWAQGLETRTMIESRRSSALFAYDDATRGFIFGSFGRPLGRALGERQDRLEYAVPTNKDPKGREDFLKGLVGVEMDSEICSLAISPSRVLMTAAMGGSRPACVHLTRLASPQTIAGYEYIDPIADIFLATETQSVQPSFHYVSDISTFLRCSTPGTTFWSSSPRPLPSHADFALGTSSDTILITPDESSWTFSQSIAFTQSQSDGNESRAEVLAVDWLSQNTILNGCRSGQIYLWDVRSATSASTSCPLIHPSSIAHVRRENENKVVVAGIENQLCTYDLRFLTPTVPSQLGASTRPYLSFAANRNRYVNGLAVGFDLKGDLIAAGTDDERVQVFDGRTGRELQTGAGGELGRRKLAGTARCLKFVNGVYGEEKLRLYVAAGESIEEWAW